MERETDISHLMISPAPALDEMPCDMLKKMLAHWISLKGNADVPDAKMINPLSYSADTLPYISIVEIEKNTHKYKTRLSGSAICDAFGQNPTGQYLSETNNLGPVTERRLDWCVENRTPYLVSDKYNRPGRPGRPYKLLSLPYKDDKGNISRILSTFLFE